jgi:uncharacterized protein YyaL (SSP411 family)
LTNRLATESSPYLRQHAGNPVHWWPWSADALAEARATDRPILLSIGYAACHWCHVMAHESFEDAATAELMNAHFVNIKVDREERPDLDGIYMQAVQAMTGHGGWPMTMFLTPDGQPFFGGTYFPPQDRHGLPGFRRVLTSVADAWRTKRSDITQSAVQVMSIYQGDGHTPGADAGSGLGEAALRTAFDGIRRMRERRFEGLGGAPKFPHAMALDYCIRHWARTGDPDALEIGHRTFLAMARGGIYDQVGGGFHRYSTDAHWLVPHFEKMLYDNALLARLGVHLWQATGDADIRRVTVETLQWMRREMTSPGGAFHSSLDADSEGKEGVFYTWTETELREALGADFEACARAWNVTAGGNFEGRNILHRSWPPDVTDDARDQVLERAKTRLYELRARREWPGRDDKVIASWNGLAVRAFAEAGRVLDDPTLTAAAVRAMECLEREMVEGNRVIRAWMPGGRRVGGFLEDHAALGLACVSLYQATFERRWLDRARAWADATVRWFWSDGDGVFFDTASDHESLIVRPRDVADNATPAGPSLAAELQLFVAEYFGDPDARARAERVISGTAAALERMPVMLGHLLGAADMAVRGAVEVVVCGDPASDAALALLDVARERYVPSLVLAAGAGDDVAGLPLFAGRSPAGATAYVCRHYTCDTPTTDPRVLAAQLEAIRSR